MPVSKPFSALRKAASAACWPIWRLSSLRAMRSSTVCMRAAVTPSKLNISNRIKATNRTTPLCFDRWPNEKDCFCISAPSRQRVTYGDGFFEHLAGARVVRRGDQGSQQVVGLATGGVGRARRTRRQQRDFHAHDGIEVRDQIGGHVLGDLLSLGRIQTV